MHQNLINPNATDPIRDEPKQPSYSRMSDEARRTPISDAQTDRAWDKSWGNHSRLAKKWGCK
jgi:hypothetical protein